MPFTLKPSCCCRGTAVISYNGTFCGPLDNPYDGVPFVGGIECYQTEDHPGVIGPQIAYHLGYDYRYDWLIGFGSGGINAARVRECNGAFSPTHQLLSSEDMTEILQDKYPGGSNVGFFSQFYAAWNGRLFAQTSWTDVASGPPRDHTALFWSCDYDGGNQTDIYEESPYNSHAQGNFQAAPQSCGILEGNIFTKDLHGFVANPYRFRLNGSIFASYPSGSLYDFMGSTVWGNSAVMSVGGLNLATGLSALDETTCLFELAGGSSPTEYRMLVEKLIDAGLSSEAEVEVEYVCYHLAWDSRSDSLVLVCTPVNVRASGSGGTGTTLGFDRYSFFSDPYTQIGSTELKRGYVGFVKADYETGLATLAPNIVNTAGIKWYTGCGIAGDRGHRFGFVAPGALPPHFDLTGVILPPDDPPDPPLTCLGLDLCHSVQFPMPELNVGISGLNNESDPEFPDDIVWTTSNLNGGYQLDYGEFTDPCVAGSADGIYSYRVQLGTVDDYDDPGVQINYTDHGNPDVHTEQYAMAMIIVLFCEDGLVRIRYCFFEVQEFTNFSGGPWPPVAAISVFCMEPNSGDEPCYYSENQALPCGTMELQATICYRAFSGGSGADFSDNYFFITAAVGATPISPP